jgi:hypothetical protein
MSGPAAKRRILRPEKNAEYVMVPCCCTAGRDQDRSGPAERVVLRDFVSVRQPAARDETLPRPSRISFWDSFRFQYRQAADQKLDRQVAGERVDKQ